MSALLNFVGPVQKNSDLENKIAGVYSTLTSKIKDLTGLWRV